MGSSAHGCFGDDYYVQNYYEQNLYREAISKGNLPIYRGMKLGNDDKIRRNIVRDIRTYFNLNFKELNEKHKINFKEYFKKELSFLKEFEDDGLVNIKG